MYGSYFYAKIFFKQILTGSSFSMIVIMALDSHDLTTKGPIEGFMTRGWSFSMGGIHFRTEHLRGVLNLKRL